MLSCETQRLIFGMIGNPALNLQTEFGETETKWSV